VHPISFLLFAGFTSPVFGEASFRRRSCTYCLAWHHHTLGAKPGWIPQET
jgi:hypothetical protein